MFVILLIIILWIYHLLDNHDREALQHIGEFILIAAAQLVHASLNFCLNFILLVLCYQYWSPFFNLPVRPDYYRLIHAWSSFNFFTIDPNYVFTLPGLPTITPFQTAIQHADDANILDLLVDKGADLNFKTPKGESIVHLSASAGCLSGLRFALEHGVDPDLVDEEGETAAMCAVKRAPLPSLLSILNLLKDGGASNEKVTPAGDSLLHICVSRIEPSIQSLERAKEVVDFSIAAGIDKHVANHKGLTPADILKSLKNDLLASVQKTVEIDSRYGLDSRTFQSRFISKFDSILVKLQSEESNLQECTVTERGPTSRGNSISSTLKSLLRSRGAQLIDLPINTVSQPATPPTNLEASLTTLTECSICLENQANTALDPCGHCVCHQCSNELPVCPFCRSLVRKTLRIYR